VGDTSGRKDGQEDIAGSERMAQRKGGFTLVEVAVAVVVMGLLLIVLVPTAKRARNGDGLEVSRFNLSRIMQATIQYCADHAGRVPLRACGYSNGQVTGGWDTWNVGGKNCRFSWTGQVFDEPAYARFLNPYLYTGRIPKPPGYLSTGSGSTWSFFHGTPTPQQRALEIPVFRSPGDTMSWQSGVTPIPGLSAYNDVGTSYLANMKWWGAPGMPGGSFNAQFNGGVDRINLAFAGANPNYVFMHDQTADVVANHTAPFQMLGEFGKVNASMMGFADGHVSYEGVIPGALSGPGYTFLP